ncbi:putative tRNA-splicing endonuclease subunit tsp-4 [Cladorrhinum sp. PSN259]|nr:putative tRNA-splicing endonuclease subunit tsp-4 [Cladorrhinum sp. PSN259]
MAEETTVKKARISLVGGSRRPRYLVFDIEDVMAIRRNNGICAVLTGTMPQNPTQNLFLGLPVELRAEEARLLVDAGAAYVVDEFKEHLASFSSFKETGAAYLEDVKEKRVLAQKVFDEEKERVRALHADKALQGSKKKKNKKSEEPAVEGGGDLLFGGGGEESKPVEEEVKKAEKAKPLPGITPTTSEKLVPEKTEGVDIPVHPSYPFYKHLNSRGYYTTPGLRFGGDYSVYPGDPFRYHAHYLANAYGWNEEIPMLDVVTSGRLGTAVKKSFLFGAEQPAATPEEDGEVRMFCIEWAGM